MPRRHGTEKPDSKDLGERILQLATLASILLGLPLAVVNGRPTSSIAILATVLLFIGMRLLHLRRKRPPSRNRKRDTERLLMASLALLVSLGLVITIAIPVSRSYFIYNLLGFLVF